MPTVPQRWPEPRSPLEEARQVVERMDAILGMYKRIGPPPESTECSQTLHFNCGDSECQCECHEDDCYGWPEAE